MKMTMTTIKITYTGNAKCMSVSQKVSIPIKKHESNPMSRFSHAIKIVRKFGVEYGKKVLLVAYITLALNIIPLSVPTATVKS